MYSMFDDVLEKARMVADIAGKKTGEAVEISRYKVEALRLSNQVKNLHEQLGSTIYSMTKHDYDNPELVESLVDEIDETLLTLEAVNEKIAELKNIARCDICGAKNGEENYYCCRCGSKIKNNYKDGFYSNENGEKMTFDNVDCSCGCGDECGNDCICDDDCNCDCNTKPQDTKKEAVECSCGCGDECGNDCICDEDCTCECDK